MLGDLPELAELDINPLWANHEGVIALDARVRLSLTARSGADNFAITPYPAHLAETIDWHGEAIVLRPIRPEDEPQHRAFVERLQPRTCGLRFFYSRRELPRSELARLTQIDYSREMAFVAVRTASGETLGVVRAIADPDNLEAEFAVIVRSDLKGRGLGHILLGKMIAYLKDKGTRRMVGIVMRENKAMRALALAQGMAFDAAGSEPDSLRFVLPLFARRLSLSGSGGRGPSTWPGPGSRTEPSTMFMTSPWPREPITTRSNLPSSARAAIESATWPTVCTKVASRPC
jgi:acetyltransferase